MRTHFVTQSLTIILSLVPALVQAQHAEPWEQPYSGRDANGPHVLGFWRFETGQELEDSSGRGRNLTLRGGTIHTDGKFGSCLESFPGWPVKDEQHAAVVAHHASLSPTGPFSLEMWIQAKPELAEVRANVYLIDKKYVTDNDYQLVLDAPARDGGRRLRASLGFGQDSATWYSDHPLKLEPGTWSHLAMTYDAAGTLRFYLDGVPIGGGLKMGRGAIVGGGRPLSIGDRAGSLYAGFPGLIDEVRLTSGVREFRPMSVADVSSRRVFVRGEPDPTLAYRVTNHHRTAMKNVRLTMALPDVPPTVVEVDEIRPGEHYDLTFKLDPLLRPDAYEVSIQVIAESDGHVLDSREKGVVTIVPRQSPHRMPVVMWGIGGVDGPVNELQRLKQIGFTHCLGLTCDYGSVWKAGEPTVPTNPENIASAARMLDRALANDLGIVISLSPGRWLEDKPEMRRIDRDGKPTSRANLANLSPELEAFFYNVGASVANQWGNHPAFQAGLVSTEVRDGTSPSFHPQEREAFRKFAGFDIPEVVRTSRGVNWTELDDVPESRIVPDDHPLLMYYRWFWKQGDGWNSWHTALHRGLRTASEHRATQPFWTFFDPAVRAPSLYGSGGEVDYLSHWTYTYPDPIRIGLCTDELLTMAGGSSRPADSPQQVMKMTQLIWYRSQTAPTGQGQSQAERSPWEDFDPDAAYITIAPMHLREALWMKLSRPIQGIMYHGWGSLVPGSTSSYRYTHQETQHELTRLIGDVVEPLGPALRQIPAPPADVAMLESFTSQMLARRGTYGWGHSWAGDCWHVLQYAHLQTEIVYEETILDRGLDQYRVLVLPDCDVLPASVADRIRAFQQRGGIVVGDTRLAPGVTPDWRLTPYVRTKQADQDQAALIELASELRRQLDARYTRIVDADQADVILYRRQAGESEYVFAINDRRTFGNYVGQHKLVMEQGLPATATIRMKRPTSSVYDLRRSRLVNANAAGDKLEWPVTLAPADGALFLITPRPIEKLVVNVPHEAAAGDRAPLSIRVTDRNDQLIDAVIPVKVEILDPDGRPAEYSGHHAVVGGELTIPWELAANDVRGVWTIRVEERATGQMTQQFVQVR